MLRLPLVLSIASLVLSGCANYGEVAKLNRTNQDYLARLDAQLSSNAKVKPLYDKLGSSRAATLQAQSQAGLASIEAKAKFSDANAQQIYLNAELARIQTQFNEEADASAQRAALLRALDGKLADAAKALHENGKDIQRYLDLGVLERLFTDVRGMDTTKLKQIGEDLKSISGRLAPVAGRLTNGGVEP